MCTGDFQCGVVVGACLCSVPVLVVREIPAVLHVRTPFTSSWFALQHSLSLWPYPCNTHTYVRMLQICTYNIHVPLLETMGPSSLSEVFRQVWRATWPRVAWRKWSKAVRGTRSSAYKPEGEPLSNVLNIYGLKYLIWASAQTLATQPVTCWPRHFAPIHA